MELINLKVVLTYPDGNTIECIKQVFRDDAEWVARQYDEMNNAEVSAYIGDTLIYPSKEKA